MSLDVRQWLRERWSGRFPSRNPDELERAYRLGWLECAGANLDLFQAQIARQRDAAIENQRRAALVATSAPDAPYVEPDPLPPFTLDDMRAMLELVAREIPPFARPR